MPIGFGMVRIAIVLPGGDFIGETRRRPEWRADAAIGERRRLEADRRVTAFRQGKAGADRAADPRMELPSQLDFSWEIIAFPTG